MVDEKKAELSPRTALQAEVRKKLRTEGGADLHVHAEGWLTAVDLEEIADRFEISVTGGIHTSETASLQEGELNRKFWHGAQEIMTPGPGKSLPDFINALPTRWMRLLLIQGINQGIHPEELLGAYFDKILLKAKSSHIRLLELHASPLALVGEGNMLDPISATPPQPEPEKYAKLKGRPMSEDEKLTFMYEDRLLTLWHNSINSSSVNKSEPNIKKEAIPTTEMYFNTFAESLNKIKKQKNNKLDAGIKYCIRRENKADNNLKNNPSDSDKRDQLVADIFSAYDNGLIIGVDIAGFENAVPLSEFSQLFTELTAHGIPYTVHAGEIARNDDLDIDRANRQMAFNNLATAIRGGETFAPSERIGHAVRLLDDDIAEPYIYIDPSSGKQTELTMMQLLENAINQGTYIELNLTSNLWTGVVKDGNSHPIIKALKGDHALFRQKPELYDKFIDLVIPCSDDPVVWVEHGGNEPTVKEFTELYTVLGVKPQDVGSQIKKAYARARRATLIHKNDRDQGTLTALHIRAKSQTPVN